jgi:hypothetical protein
VRAGGVVAVLGALFLLAGCGGEDGGGQLSAEELRGQADAICAKYDDEFNALGEPTSADELDAFLEEAIPLVEEQTNELENLDAPDELADDWDRAMAVQREGLANVRALQDAVQDGDATRIQELLAEAKSIRAESDQLARDLGLETCGEES